MQHSNQVRKIGGQPYPVFSNKVPFPNNVPYYCVYDRIITQDSYMLLAFPLLLWSLLLKNRCQVYECDVVDQLMFTLNNSKLRCIATYIHSTFIIFKTRNNIIMRNANVLKINWRLFTDFRISNFLKNFLEINLSKTDILI